MKCHGTSLTWTRRVWAWEERSRWIGPTTRFEQNIKGEVKKCVVNTALFDQREGGADLKRERFYPKNLQITMEPRRLPWRDLFRLSLIFVAVSSTDNHLYRAGLFISRDAQCQKGYVWFTKDTISAIDRSWASNWCWILWRCKWALPQLKYWKAFTIFACEHVARLVASPVVAEKDRIQSPITEVCRAMAGMLNWKMVSGKYNLGSGITIGSCC